MGDEVEREQDGVSIVVEYLLMTNPWYQWMRRTERLLSQPIRPLIDNNQLSLEEGNDLA